MRTLLDYVIDAPLGRGSRSLVHRARRLPGGSAVALKCPLVSGDGAESALLHEATMLTRCVHPSVIGLVEIVRMGETDPPLALALDLVEGSTVAQLMFGGDPLDEGVVARIGLDIAGALAAIHANGVVHADVKPANIIVDAVGQAVLIDFETAFDVDSEHIHERRLTERYAAPEVLDGHTPSPAADIWALATMLIEARSPRHGPPSPGDLVDALRPCTDPDPARRPSAEALLPALRSIPTTEAELERLPSPPPGQPTGGDAAPPPPTEPAVTPRDAGTGTMGTAKSGSAVDPHPTVVWGPRPPNRLDEHLRKASEQTRLRSTKGTRRAGVLTTVAGAALGLVGLVALAGWASDTFSGPSPSLATGTTDGSADPGDPIDTGDSIDGADGTMPEEDSTRTSETPPPDPPIRPCAGPAPAGASAPDGSTSGSVSDLPTTSLPPATRSVILTGDIDGVGCTRSVTWDAARAHATVNWSSGERHYALGRAGDQLVLGDWDADGRATPGLYRPSTGEAFLFGGWAEPDAPLPSAEVIDTDTTGGTAVVRTAIAGTADHLVVNPP